MADFLNAIGISRKFFIQVVIALYEIVINLLDEGLWCAGLVNQFFACSVVDLDIFEGLGVKTR